MKRSYCCIGTKFALNWCFGLDKQCCTKIDVYTFDGIANNVSRFSSVNALHLVGNLDDKVNN